MNGTPVTPAVAYRAVAAADLPELVAVVVALDELRLALGAVGRELRDSSQFTEALSVEVLAVRARRALVGFFDQAERQSAEAPAPAAPPVPAVMPAKARKGGVR